MSDNRQSLADLGATLNQQAAAAPAQTAAAGEAPAAPAERVSTTEPDDPEPTLATS